ncbi:MAG: glycosyltransferase family 2 protein [Bacteroidota bacterium]
MPAFNEEKSISSVVNEIILASSNSDYEIIPIVINDCSTDRTEEVIKKLDCVAIHLPINLGIGGAVETGYKFALENGFDYAVQVDGDGQHPPEFIPDMIHELKKNNLDVVIGSRYISKQGFQSSFMRRMGINYFKNLNYFLTGMIITDSTSGFRMLNKKALQLLSENYPDEYPEPEAIILYCKFGLKTGEVSVKMKERQGGKSSINAFSSVYYMIKVSIAVIFTRLRKR